MQKGCIWAHQNHGIGTWKAWEIWRPERSRGMRGIVEMDRRLHSDVRPWNQGWCSCKTLKHQFGARDFAWLLAFGGHIHVDFRGVPWCTGVPDIFWEPLSTSFNHVMLHSKSWYVLVLVRVCRLSFCCRKHREVKWNLPELENAPKMWTVAGCAKSEQVAKPLFPGTAWFAGFGAEEGEEKERSKGMTKD